MENILNRSDFWLNRSVLVTGHTGFTGSWLSLCLQNFGAKILGYALSPPTSPSLFELAEVCQNMVSIIADIRDFDRLLSVFKRHKPEIVIHLAAQPLVRYSYVDPIETYSTNVLGTVHLLEAVRQTKSVRVVLNVTTDKCYENKEWIWGYRENDRLGGYDPYSNSKACSELVTQAYRDSFFTSEESNNCQVALATARVGNVIGGGDWAEDRLIPDCIRAFLKKEKVVVRYPDAIRPWQHVLESINGYILLVEKLYKDGKKFCQPWNFGADENQSKSVSWMVNFIVDLWGDGATWKIDARKNPHEAKNLKLDCSKAKEKLGWKPNWDIKKALEKTIDWYKVYKEQPEIIREITQRQISEYFKHNPF